MFEGEKVFVISFDSFIGSTCTQASGKAAASNCISNSKELQVEALVSLNAYKIEEGLFHGYVRSSEVQNYQDLQRG